MYLDNKLSGFIRIFVSVRKS